MARNECKHQDGRHGACPRGATIDGRLTIVAPRRQDPWRRQLLGDADLAASHRSHGDKPRGAAIEVEDFWSMANPLPVAEAIRPPLPSWQALLSESNWWLARKFGRERHLRGAA